MLGKQAQMGEKLTGPFHIEYAAQGCSRSRRRWSAAPSQAELDEADEVEQEEGVNETIAAAPGTKDEAKPGKRNAKASQDPVEKKTPREVFEYVIEQGRKEYQVQRYKGLGEMTAPQLWETTMDPARRTLLQVKLEDIAATEEIFTTLMGEDVESAPQVHRRECAGCEEPRYLSAIPIHSARARRGTAQASMADPGAILWSWAHSPKPAQTRQVSPMLLRSMAARLCNCRPAFTLMQSSCRLYKTEIRFGLIQHLFNAPANRSKHGFDPSMKWLPVR